MLPAIQALRDYIDRRYEGSVSAFARDNVRTGDEYDYQINASEISKILRGERGDRMTVKAAAAIEDATGSTVRIRMWLPTKKR